MTEAYQIKAARALLGWNQDDLANASGVGISTIRRMEGKAGPIRGNAGSVRKVQTALEGAGVHFINPTDGGIGVQTRGSVVVKA
jgi:transcriptional regulator with XRE-family HTH domain